MTLDRDSSTFFPLEFGHHLKLLWHGTAQHISFNQQMLIQTLKFTDVTNVQCSYQMHLNDSSTLFRYRIQEFICSTDDCSQQKWYKVRGASKSGWNRIEYFKRRLRFKDFFTAHCFQLGIHGARKWQVKVLQNERDENSEKWLSRREWDFRVHRLLNRFEHVQQS